MSSAVNADGSAVGYSAGARRFKHLTSLQGRVGQETYKPRPVDGTWGPVDACPLKRNWAAAEEPQVPTLTRTLTTRIPTLALTATPTPTPILTLTLTLSL